MTYKARVKMTSPDSDTEAEFAQFVCFRTAEPVPVDLFQQSWIPFAEEFFARGIKTIILSEKLPLSGDLSPCKFIAKSYWASITAVKLTFEKGLPSPSSKGHITASQVNMVYIILTGLRHENIAVLGQFCAQPRPQGFILCLAPLHMNPPRFPISRLTSKSFVKFSMCSYERVGWLVTEMSVIGLEISPYERTLQPGYWDERGMNSCEMSPVFSRNL